MRLTCQLQVVKGLVSAASMKAKTKTEMKY